MNYAALYIVRQNFNSKCFKCGEEKKFFTVYRCGKCKPQTVEKYCYECCEASLIPKDGGEIDDGYIDALCMNCAFCYDYINVSKFYKDQKKNGWQGLKFDCDACSCCCGGTDCLTGSLCCCVSENDDDDEDDDDDDGEKKIEDNKQFKE